MKAVRRVIALLLAAALLAALAGCAGKTPTEGAIPGQDEDSVVGEAAGSAGTDDTGAAGKPLQALCFAYFPEDAMNPYSCDNVYNESLDKLIYEGLFSLQSDYTAENCLCASYNTGDNMTWVFDLRKNIFFHDGSQLTAGDVVYSLAYSGQIKGQITATAEDQVTIVLDRANANLPGLLDIAIVPSGAAEQTLPPGTGPYQLYLEGNTADLKRFERWNGTDSLPDTISLYKAYDIADVIGAFGSGDVSVTVTGYGEYDVGSSVSCDTWDCPTAVMQFVGFNCDNGQCSDYRLRCALQYAIDRDAVASESLGSQARGAVLPVNTTSAEYDWALDAQYSYSPDKFSQAMEDMYGGDVNGNGYWDLTGWDVELDLIVNSESNEKVAAAKQIANGLEELGIKVYLHVLDWEAFIAALESTDYDMYYGEVRLTNDFSLYELLDGSLNYSRFTLASDWDDLYPYLFSRAPLISLCFESSSVLTRRGEISGLDPIEGNIYNGLSNWTAR